MRTEELASVITLRDVPHDTQSASALQMGASSRTMRGAMPAVMEMRTLLRVELTAMTTTTWLRSMTKSA
jgi:hypothetical protein